VNTVPENKMNKCFFRIWPNHSSSIPTLSRLLCRLPFPRRKRERK
jgi:hypothetical protein